MASYTCVHFKHTDDVLVTKVAYATAKQRYSHALLAQQTEGDPTVELMLQYGGHKVTIDAGAIAYIEERTP